MQKKLLFKTDIEARKINLSIVSLDNATIVEETTKAVKVEVIRALPCKRNIDLAATDDNKFVRSTFNDEIWIPKSQISSLTQTTRRGTGKFNEKGREIKERIETVYEKAVSSWFLKKENLTDIIEIL